MDGVGDQCDNCPWNTIPISWTLTRIALETPVTTIRILMKMATRTIWTTVPMCPMPTRLTTIKMARGRL